MELYQQGKEKIKAIKAKPFKLEKEIQDLIEKSTDAIFGIEFIRSEFTVDKYRVDSLCFDHENNAFVIIEYKKGSSYSVIDQGYTYLQLLLNNKSDFILALSQYRGKVLNIQEVDWSASKIIFISQSFNSYQKDSVNFKNLPFELFEIKRFENDVIVLNQHKSTSKESIAAIGNPEKPSVISSVNKEVKSYDEEDHIKNSNPEIEQAWEALRDRIVNLDDTDLTPKKHYIALSFSNKTVAYFNFRKSSISIEIPRGNLNPDGTTSKNYFTLDDPKGLALEKSWTWKSGTQGTIYVIKFTQNTDLDYLMFLLKQKVKNIND
jgi:hypothetical protein